MVSVALMIKVMVKTVIVKNYICQFYDIRSSLATMISEYKPTRNGVILKIQNMHLVLSRK